MLTHRTPKSVEFFPEMLRKLVATLVVYSCSSLIRQHSGRRQRQISWIPDFVRETIPFSLLCHPRFLHQYGRAPHRGATVARVEAQSCLTSPHCPVRILSK